ncbi:MAG: Si-specific NAD(P)(+) transhydrogenase [Planctomycetes bacterium]|nr:Si-specific NAD(P)(+) transhydrogenase [Planctomycetota bacterium]
MNPNSANSARSGGPVPEPWDVVVIGSGPAGQKAAVQAAKAGRRTAVVERDLGVGGACVHRGTIPSKTLRETAVRLVGFRARMGRHMRVEIPPDLQLASLMDRMESVVRAHVAYQEAQLQRNGITDLHGRARFVDPHTIAVESVYGETRLLRAETIVIATGSRPRTPSDIHIDHEHVFDSDSVLGMAYLPKSMVVLGGGVIACEYATIFASLGVQVTLVDKTPRPLAFLDGEILDRFTTDFEANPGCTWIGNAKVTGVEWNGVDAVVTRLDNGWELKSEKVLFALGRVANVEGLAIEAAGLTTNARGHLQVDAECRTAVPHILAVGDVIGPPSLASASMEQGRRAMCAALHLPKPVGADLIPTGIYTIPEIASVGLAEAEARAQHGDCLVGRARFAELARGQIAGSDQGLLKLVVAADSLRVLGCQIIGEGATELVHLAQMAMLTGADATMFVDRIFNFPTLAEAYRVASLDVLGQLQKRCASAAPTPLPR